MPKKLVVIYGVSQQSLKSFLVTVRDPGRGWGITNTEIEKGVIRCWLRDTAGPC